MEKRDKNNDNRPTVHTPAEGVRIIGAEEAAAVLEAGEAAGRRPDDAPRFGDVPSSPQGPRPSHRFPLPEAVDPSDIAKPSIASTENEVDSPANPEMPHWTEPPTGEVPAIFNSDDEDDTDWAAMRNRGPRWRDDSTGWSDEDELADAALLAGDDEARLGALDTTKTEHSDLFSFDDEETQEDEPDSIIASHEQPQQLQGRDVTKSINTRSASREPFDGQRSASHSREMGPAIATGAGAAIIALIAFNTGPAATMVLTTAVIFMAALEVFEVLRRGGFRPVTLLGLTAVTSMMIASYNNGEPAIPLVLLLTFVFSLLWYLASVAQGRPTISVASTLMGVIWVGLLGSYASLLLRLPGNRGVAFLAGAVLASAIYDIAAYFVGTQFGQHPIHPSVSPNKTWEGAAGGTFAALAVCVLVISQISPWGSGDVIWLWLIVAVMAPLGDFCQSMIKRDLGVKDMGNLLPGHGGFMNRFDALLFVIPATYYLVHVLDLA